MNALELAQQLAAENGPIQRPRFRMRPPRDRYTDAVVDLPEYTDHAGKKRLRWLDQEDADGTLHKGLRVYLDGRPVIRSLCRKHCVVCRMPFLFTTYSWLADPEEAVPPFVPDHIVRSGRAYIARLRRCDYHRGAYGPAVKTRRGNRMVAALAGYFRERGIPVVKGRAGVGQIDWYTLYNRSFSLLDNHRNMNVAAYIPAPRYAWEAPALDWRELNEGALPAARQAESLDAEDSESYYQILSDEEEKQDGDTIKPHVHRAPESPAGVAQRVRAHINEMDALMRKEFNDSTARWISEQEEV